MTPPDPETVGVPALHRAALIAAFSAMGIVGATVPASIPGASLRLGTTPDELLPGVSALFLGLFAGVSFVAVLRRSQRSYLVAGLLLQGAGLALLAASASSTMFFVACTTSGVGFAFVETSATALTRAVAAGSTPRYLTLLNGAAAVGAASAPLVIVLFPPTSQAAPIAILCSVPLLGATLAWFGVPRSDLGRAASRRMRRRHVPVDRSRVRFGSLAFVGVALFAFVGAETVVSGWSSVLPESLLHVSASQAAVGTSLFWLLVAVGRFMCAAILRRGIAPQRYLLVVLAAASVLAAAAAIVQQGICAAVLAAAATVLIAPVYALLLGVALAQVHDSAAVPRVTAALVAVGSAGGVVVSFAVALGAGSAPTAVFLSVAAVLAVCMVLVVVDLRASRDRL